jgi:hypothetical protein
VIPVHDVKETLQDHLVRHCRVVVGRDEDIERRERRLALISDGMEEHGVIGVKSFAEMCGCPSIRTEVLSFACRDIEAPADYPCGSMNAPANGRSTQNRQTLRAHMGENTM